MEKVTPLLKQEVVYNNFYKLLTHIYFVTPIIKKMKFKIKDIQIRAIDACIIKEKLKHVLGGEATENAKQDRAEVN